MAWESSAPAAVELVMNTESPPEGWVVTSNPDTYFYRIRRESFADNEIEVIEISCDKQDATISVATYHGPEELIDDDKFTCGDVPVDAVLHVLRMCGHIEEPRAVDHSLIEYRGKCWWHVEDEVDQLRLTRSMAIQNARELMADGSPQSSMTYMEAARMAGKMLSDATSDGLARAIAMLIRDYKMSEPG